MNECSEFTKAQVQQDFARACEYADESLRLGLFSRLLNRHASRYPDEQTNLLSAAVMNEILAEEPTNSEGRRYLQERQDLIALEASKVYEDSELVGACSCLYAVQIIYWNFQAGQAAALGRSPAQVRNRPMELAQRASQLRIHIPNTYELGGSGDAIDSIVAICRIAKEFRP
jgi:hypothetical protein